jgi:hypothetical protein
MLSSSNLAWRASGTDFVKWFWLCLRTIFQGYPGNDGIALLRGKKFTLVKNTTLVFLYPVRLWSRGPERSEIVPSDTPLATGVILRRRPYSHTTE